ncbi:hypothetical protein Q7C36_021526 [Tachysurus vachellii]|uniref:Uncharacterized protein n=1 Tax=Tachysurus vachellii TaxID=175792 RepID=A0AA88ISD0_TACVA|nr:hypothetical protein Q7C36_021526 [Tachysurus vachellii]
MDVCMLILIAEPWVRKPAYVLLPPPNAVCDVSAYARRRHDSLLVPVATVPVPGPVRSNYSPNPV